MKKTKDQIISQKTQIADGFFFNFTDFTGFFQIK